MAMPRIVPNDPADAQVNLMAICCMRGNGSKQRIVPTVVKTMRRTMRVMRLGWVITEMDSAVVALNSVCIE